MKPILAIDSIQLSYDNRVILSDVYLECRQGEAVGLLGRIGCGKSSLLQIAFGTKKQLEYSIRVDNSNVKPAFQSKVGIHYLPQFSFLPKEISILNAVKYFNISFDFFAKKMPDIAIHHKEKIEKLSGGQTRMLELFLLLFTKGKFVFLDEPFTHIMPLHLEKIKEWINEAKGSKGIIITDHLYEHVLTICEKLYLLRDGKTYLCQERADLVSLGYLHQ